jgi:hypothetical protein
MPNVRDLAAADLRLTLEDENGAGTPYTLIDKDGVEYPLVGTFDDIGLLIDPVSGEAIQGRAISATCRAQTILAASGKIPERGWKARVPGLDGKTITLFIQRNQYDRTIGLCLLTLGLKLGEVENE